jgi:AraC family transcriptional regulator of adaptative response/methylated-DNA-[protein]-cysteine methyltransferase
MDENRLSQSSQDYQRVEQAIRFLEENFQQQPSLEEIAASVHLSKYHFQRLFKRWAGVSPTQFMHFLTIEYAKLRLQESQTILDAALDAGLSGPSRLHDLFVTFEAITPGEYKRHGADLEIAYGYHDTPFGRCLIASTSRGICGLYFLSPASSSTVLQRLTSQWPKAKLIHDQDRTRPLVERVFAAPSLDETRPLHLLVKGTNFQIKVWQALLSIPPGFLASYQEIAAHLGRPKASRAVGGAVSQNPIAYLIPCHRVITKVGRIHGYRWGVTRKQAMLGWEASRRHLERPHTPPRVAKAPAALD